MQDAIGQRGEAIFVVSLTKLYGRRKPIYRPSFLGYKWPGVDFIVELNCTVEGIRPFFFVQVRATRRGYTKKKRLKVQLNFQGLKRLTEMGAPTYVAGIDEPGECGFLVAAPQLASKGASSISTRFPIDESIQDLLYEEVKSYWKRLGKRRFSSKFIDSNCN